MELISVSTEPEFDLHWQMTHCERFALKDILRRTQPEVAIEVGTYEGGSLQVLSRFSEQVFSIDIDGAVKAKLSPRFENVVFRTGSSHQQIPLVLKDVEAHGRNVEFVLIDGEHSATGVQRDINAILALQPRKPCVILVHDSFNPACRVGIRGADWSLSPHVHAVDLDFVPGVYHEEAYDTAGPRTMWGGFACALLLPEARREPLRVKASQQGLFDAVFARSAHKAQTRLPARARRFIRKMFPVRVRP